MLGQKTSIYGRICVGWQLTVGFVLTEDEIQTEFQLHMWCFLLCFAGVQSSVLKVGIGVLVKNGKQKSFILENKSLTQKYLNTQKLWIGSCLLL